MNASSSNLLRVLVVDDEAPARRKVLRLLREEADVQVAGEADSGESAVLAIEKHRPDLVFLDVQMPGMDGFGVIAAVESARMPRFVFVTAHDKFALRAFEVHAFDYLLKPFTGERFRDALRRVREENARSSDAFASRLHEMLTQMQRERGFPDRLLIHEDSRAFFLAVSDIAWIEADRNYALLHCGAKTYTVRKTLDALQDSLDPNLFLRVNRSSIVRVEAIREMLPWFHGEYKVVLHDKTELRWARRYVSQRPELVKLR